MNFDLEKRTIFLCKHGSHAYGLNVPTSDEDFKGICIKPAAAYLGFTQRFEQHEHMGSKSDGIDKVIYSLDKFVALAADCNPNIIEILHVADEDVLKCDEFGEALRAKRDDFLSKKAKFTFAGYAHQQLKRIKTHRAWLLEKPSKPERADFGLSDSTRVSKSELGAFDSLVAQEIELHGLDAFVTDEGFWERIVYAFKYIFGRRAKPADVITLFTREKAFQAALTHYNQYLDWLKKRNPARAALEAQFGYDTKHGMHLMRLCMMAILILEKHIVRVKWTGPEREFLMSVRNGELPYEPLVEQAEALEKRAAELYLTSTLRKDPNRADLDKYFVGLTETYLRLHG